MLMLLLIESLIGIALFSLIVIPMDLKDPLAVIGDYPPAIRKRCEELGLIEKRKQQLSKKDDIPRNVLTALRAERHQSFVKHFVTPMYFLHPAQASDTSDTVPDAHQRTSLSPHSALTFLPTDQSK